MAWSVAYRLALLSVDDECRPIPGSKLLNCLARIGTLVDLTLDGRIDFTSTTARADTRPRGSSVHAKALDDIARHPQRTAQDFIDRSSLRMRDVLDEVRPSDTPFQPVWRRQLSAEHVNGEFALLADVIDGKFMCGPHSAAVISLAEALSWIELPEAGSFRDRCGPASGLVADSAAYLPSVLRKLSYRSRAWRSVGTNLA